MLCIPSELHMHPFWLQASSQTFNIVIYCIYCYIKCIMLNKLCVYNVSNCTMRLFVFAVHFSGLYHFCSRRCCGLRLCRYERSLYLELSSPFSSKNSSDSSSFCSWSEYNQFWNDTNDGNIIAIIEFQMVLHCVNLRFPIKAIIELFVSVSLEIYNKWNVHTRGSSNYNMLFCLFIFFTLHC